MSIYHIDLLSGSNSNSGLSWSLAWKDFTPFRLRSIVPGPGDLIKVSKFDHVVTYNSGVKDLDSSKSLLNLSISDTDFDNSVSWSIFTTSNALSSAGSGYTITSVSSNFNYGLNVVRSSDYYIFADTTYAPANTKMLFTSFKAKNWSRFLAVEFRFESITNFDTSFNPSTAPRDFRIKFCSDSNGDIPVLSFLVDLKVMGDGLVRLTNGFPLPSFFRSIAIYTGTGYGFIGCSFNLLGFTATLDLLDPRYCGLFNSIRFGSSECFNEVLPRSWLSNSSLVCETFDLSRRNNFSSGFVSRRSLFPGWDVLTNSKSHYSYWTSHYAYNKSSCLTSIDLLQSFGNIPLFDFRGWLGTLSNPIKIVFGYNPLIDEVEGITAIRVKSAGSSLLITHPIMEDHDENEYPLKSYMWLGNTSNIVVENLYVYTSGKTALLGPNVGRMEFNNCLLYSTARGGTYGSQYVGNWNKDITNREDLTTSIECNNCDLTASLGFDSDLYNVYGSVRLNGCVEHRWAMYGSNNSVYFLSNTDIYSNSSQYNSYKIHLNPESAGFRDYVGLAYTLVTTNTSYDPILLSNIEVYDGLPVFSGKPLGSLTIKNISINIGLGFDFRSSAAFIRVDDLGVGGLEIDGISINSLSTFSPIPLLSYAFYGPLVLKNLSLGDDFNCLSTLFTSIQTVNVNANISFSTSSLHFSLENVTMYPKYGSPIGLPLKSPVYLNFKNVSFLASSNYTYAWSSLLFVPVGDAGAGYENGYEGFISLNFLNVRLEPNEPGGYLWSPSSFNPTYALKQGVYFKVVSSNLTVNDNGVLFLSKINHPDNQPVFQSINDWPWEVVSGEDTTIYFYNYTVSKDFVEKVVGSNFSWKLRLKTSIVHHRSSSYLLSELYVSQGVLFTITVWVKVSSLSTYSGLLFKKKSTAATSLVGVTPVVLSPSVANSWEELTLSYVPDYSGKVELYMFATGPMNTSCWVGGISTL